ncbi:MAG: pilin [Candidatus Peregrinibacteria bacterium]|nr:pilin [Candidatus Peregrinibacteria bacterium]
MKSSSSKKWLLVALIGVVAAVIIFILSTKVSAAGFLPLPEIEDVPDPEGEGLQKAYNAVWELARNFRLLIGAVAILFMVISGIKLVIMGSNEEVATKQKTNILWGFVGLALIAVAGPMGEILDLQDGGFLADEYTIGYRATLFDKQVTIIITFVKYIVGSVAVLFMIRSGAKLVIAGDSDEVLTNEKKNLMTGALALFLIMVSNVIVKEVLFKTDASEANFSVTGQEAEVSFDTARGVQEIVGITNFIVTWAAPLAVLALVVGGVMYLTAFGDEEKMTKAKKIIMNSVLALLIIYGAFAIVSTLISGVF